MVDKETEDTSPLLSPFNMCDFAFKPVDFENHQFRRYNVMKRTLTLHQILKRNLQLAFNLDGESNVINRKNLVGLIM